MNVYNTILIVIFLRRSGWSETSKDNMSAGDYSIPSELQETLLDFTVHYLVERPPDIIDFAMDYFSALQTKRNNADGQNSEDEDMESDDDIDYGESLHLLIIAFMDGIKTSINGCKSRLLLFLNLRVSVVM